MKQRSYKATGINLKAMPMGEADRLITVLTKEHGLVRAIAPGARKHKSRLAGRSGLFVVNDLLFSSGKSLDKMIQAETLMSFSGLSRDLAKLTASQYLAEIALAQALSGQPQEELYCLFIEHLSRLETATKPNILPCLAQATFHLLALAGVAPDVFRCCLSRSLLTAQLGDPNWRVGFSVSSGGAIDLAEISRLERERLSEIEPIEREWQAQRGDRPVSDSQWQTGLRSKVAKEITRNLGIVGYLSAAELALMQQLSQPELIMASAALPSASQLGSPFGSQSGTMKTGATQQSVEISLNSVIANSVLEESGPHLWWQHIEQFLRQYAQYQFDRPIKSAALIDTCFTSPSYAARV